MSHMSQKVTCVTFPVRQWAPACVLLENNRLPKTIDSPQVGV